MRDHSAMLAIVFSLCALASAGAQERQIDALVVRYAGEAGEVQYRYQDLPAAVRFLSPVAFAVRSGRLELQMDLDSGILERERSTVARRPAGELAHVLVLLKAPAAKEPRPTRTVSISFTLDELLARGGAWSAVPSAWACYLAASKSGWTSGRVWARTVAFDTRTARFTIKVGLIK
jgi:hypothetical protein